MSTHDEDDEIHQGMDALQQHDARTNGGINPAPNSRHALEALFAKKEASSSRTLPLDSLDPIAESMRQVAGLTREEAEDEARSLGLL